MVLRLQATAETQKLLSKKMAKPPCVHERRLDTFYPRRTCYSSKGRRMHNTKLLSICRRRHVAQLAP